MARFITDEVRLLRYTDSTGNRSNIYEVRLDNQIFQHDDGTLEYIGRLFVGDKYSRPLGNRNKFSPEPADFHDVKCFYKERFVITLTLEELAARGFIRKHNSSYLKDKYGEPVEVIVCEDIPPEFLKVEKVTKWQADCDFKLMMQCAGVSDVWACAYRAGVFFNVGWIWSGKKTLENYLNGTRKLYEDCYGIEDCYKEKK